MDTGRSSDDEKRQDASLPYSLLYVSIMRMLSRRIKKFFLGFFFFFSRKKNLRRLTFSRVYTCVLFVCVVIEYDERREGGLEFVTNLDLTLAGCQLSLIGPFCYRRYTHFSFPQ